MNSPAATQHKKGNTFHVRQSTVQGMTVLRTAKINLIDTTILFVKNVTFHVNGVSVMTNCFRKKINGARFGWVEWAGKNI